MRDGTYKADAEAGFFPVQTSQGYWVAFEETTPQDVNEGEYLGVWTDPDTNKIYYDKTVFISDLTEALTFAKLYNQIAIWDNANEKAIYVEA